MRSLAKKFMSFMSMLVFLVNIYSNTAKADAITDTINIIATLTCETEGLGDLLTAPFVHTCIQDAFSTLIVANIISPGIYASMFLRLRIDDNKLFDGNCLRANRADPENPTLSFGLCANWKMIEYRAEMLAKLTMAAVQNNSAHALESLANMVDSSNYTLTFPNRHNGDFGVFADIPIVAFPVFPWIVLSHGDRICVETIGFLGLLHVGCKWIAEPYPTSMYGSFFNKPSTASSKVPPEMYNYLNCATAGGCAVTAANASQAPITISSTVMECIREMLLKLLTGQTVCDLASLQSGQNLNKSDSVFYQFQVNMQRAVMGMLTLYIMFIGFKILLAGEQLPKSSELIMYIVKLVLVVYFSVGINISGGAATFDGMTSLIFPLLLDGAAEIAVWVMNATPSGLCKFLPSDYAPELGYLALWDALDCKVIHYLGIDAIMSLWVGQNSPDPLSMSVPPYVFLLIPAIYFKQINLVILAISYPLVVMSLAAYLVNSFAVCMISIAILGILAPLYVPMSLFEQTKGYFQGWYTLMISFVLQPVVVIGFMTLMFSLYDIGFYGTCLYKPMTLQVTNADGEPQNKKLFIIDNEEDNYDSQADYIACQQSIGWILNNPLASLATGLAGDGGATIDLGKSPEAEKKTADYISEFGALSGITPVMGFFIGYVSLLSQLSWTMIVNLMICLLILYLMYELSSNLGEFAADIAQSITLSGTISPRGLSDKAISGVRKLGKTAKGAAAPSMAAAATKLGEIAKGGATPSMAGGAGSSGGGAVPMVSADAGSGAGAVGLSPTSGATPQTDSGSSASNGGAAPPTNSGSGGQAPISGASSSAGSPSDGSAPGDGVAAPPTGQFPQDGGNVVGAGGNVVGAGGNVVGAGGNVVGAGGNVVGAGGNVNQGAAGVLSPTPGASPAGAALGDGVTTTPAQQSPQAGGLASQGPHTERTDPNTNTADAELKKDNKDFGN